MNPKVYHFECKLLLHGLDVNDLHMHAFLRHHLAYLVFCPKFYHFIQHSFKFTQRVNVLSNMYYSFIQRVSVLPNVY